MQLTNIRTIIIAVVALICFSTDTVFSETVTGNGYFVQQSISPISGSVSGNGYTLQQVGQVISGQISSGGYTSQSVFGSFAAPSTPTPTITYGGGGGGYYVVSTTTSASVAATSSFVSSSTILTTNGSTCATRILITQPIDTKLKNNSDDIKKLETFLNTYEGEKLKVDGVYGKADIAAVKRWQAKYKKEILSPMRLKNPTGTIYASSMRQIEKQSTASCGQAILVHSCPFFTTYVKYGDTGAEVKKVQQFLNIVQGEKIAINGKYGPGTRDAVLRFQRAHKKNIISFVTLSFISGNWNVSTRTKANEVIGCDKLN